MPRITASSPTEVDTCSSETTTHDSRVKVMSWMARGRSGAFVQPRSNLRRRHRLDATRLTRGALVQRWIVKCGPSSVSPAMDGAHSYSPDAAAHVPVHRQLSPPVWRGAAHRLRLLRAAEALLAAVPSALDMELARARGVRGTQCRLETHPRGPRGRLSASTRGRDALGGRELPPDPLAAARYLRADDGELAAEGPRPADDHRRGGVRRRRAAPVLVERRAIRAGLRAARDAAPRRGGPG